MENHSLEAFSFTPCHTGFYAWILINLIIYPSKRVHNTQKIFKSPQPQEQSLQRNIHVQEIFANLKRISRDLHIFPCM